MKIALIKDQRLKMGFTLLLALLISSIVLAISLSVFGIIIREISLSTSARESRLAFYAANAGVECAIYWDFVQGAFATSNPAATTITCNNQSFDVGGPSGVNTFQLDLDNGACAFEVEVAKICRGDLGGCGDNEPNKQIATEIRARGHNTCAGGFIVERGLLVSY